MTVLSTLLQRAQHRCELCGATHDVAPHAVAPYLDGTADQHVLVCGTCHPLLDADANANATHWYCLQQSAWTQEPAVQVVIWRLLGQLGGEPWAADLRDQIYLADEVLAWAQASTPNSDDGREPTVDSNGVALTDGDSVTIIKDLDVKGTSFVAKRGTLVKGIRLTTNPAHVEGKVNGVQIVLKTMFLKRVGS